MTCTLPVSYDEEKWASIVTESEQECISYVLHKADILLGSYALNVGIGASQFYSETENVFSVVDGITVIDLEIELGKQAALKSSTEYRLFNQNKYEVSGLDKILDHEYSIIVDVNLKMFSCCQEHWEDYLYHLIAKLAPGGQLITHTGGFGGYKDYVFESTLTLNELTMLVGDTVTVTTLDSILIPNEKLVILGAKF